MTRNSSSISSASPISIDEQELLHAITKKAIINTDNLKFRFTVKDQQRTEKPEYKLYLNKEETQFVYFSVFFTGEWIYIYIPESTNNIDEPYTYKTYTELDTFNKKQRFYKGNHISISYSDYCKSFLFHYTEYDDKFIKKPHNICNFKLSSVTSNNFDCVLCDKNGNTFKNAVFVNDDEDDYDTQKHVFNIIHKIITVIKYKKQRSKNSLKIREHKVQLELERINAEEKQRKIQEAIKKAEMQSKNKELAKEKKIRSVLGDLDPNILASLLGDSNKPKKPISTSKKSNTGNAKKK